MKKFILTSTAALFIGFASFAQEDTNSEKWYASAYIPEPAFTKDLRFDVLAIKPKSKNIVIPEVQAEFVGGYQQLKIYLKENVINKISVTTPKQFQKGSVIFTVNEKGEIINAKISRTSGDRETDNLLIEAISKMPNWIPAENLRGVKFKQEFEFSVGDVEGC